MIVRSVQESFFRYQPDLAAARDCPCPGAERCRGCPGAVSRGAAVEGSHAGRAPRCGDGTRRGTMAVRPFWAGEQGVAALGGKPEPFCCVLAGLLRRCCRKRGGNPRVFTGPCGEIVVCVGLLLRSISCLRALVAQRVGISGAGSGWRPGTGGVPRGQYWAQPCSTSSSVTWMKSQSVPSASLLMAPNWEEWWIPQQAVLPSSEPWTGWRVGQRGT